MPKASVKPTYVTHLEELMKYPDYSLMEWLAEAKRNSLTIPEKTAMKLLDFGSTRPEWQDAIADLLGEDGTAFGAHKSKWMFVHPFSDEKDLDLQWESADAIERFYLLRWLRAERSSDAWKFLTNDWNKLTSAHKIKFLEAFRIGLSAQDEEPLEKLLNDRDLGVKQAIGKLLSLIPNSQHAQGSFEFACRFLSIEPSNQNLKMIMTYPRYDDIIVDSDRRRGFAVPSRVGIYYPGVIELLVSNVEPGNWTDHFGISAKEVITAAKNSEVRIEPPEAMPYSHGGERSSFLRGCYEAATRFGNEEFARALICYGNDNADVAYPINLDRRRLTLAMSPKGREDFVLQLYKDNNDSIFVDSSIENYYELRQPFLEVLKSCEHNWSEDFSRTVLQAVKMQCDKPSDDHLLWLIKTVLPDFARFVSRTQLDEALEGWPESQEFAPAIEKFRRRILFRKEYLSAIDNG